MIPITPTGMQFLEKQLLKEKKELEELSRNKGAEYGQDGWHDEQYKAELVRESILRSQIRRHEEEMLQFTITHPIHQCSVIDLGVRVVLVMEEDEHAFVVDGYPYNKNILSIRSPIGTILMGRSVGETVSFEAPGGKKEVFIKDIRTPII